MNCISSDNGNLLFVRDLEVHFDTQDGVVRAVDGISFCLKAGQRLCLIGESGCGKTILALALMRLLPPGARMSGEIVFQGVDVLRLSDREARRVRRRGMGMVFEQPSAYLNPLFPAGWQVAEAVRLSRGYTRAAARMRALELMDMARIPKARMRYGQFPHQLSGGMRQRVMVAMALAKDPRLLIADEPTTALDPTVRRSILALLHECLEEAGAACLLITHDWEAAQSLCDTAAIMYAGHILEAGSAAQVLESPRHPYAKALHQAMGGKSPKPIPGHPPLLTALPGGCRFQPRCIHSVTDCALLAPPLNGGVRCHNHQ